MIKTNDSAAITGPVLATHKRHIWLLRLVARGILVCLPAAACLSSPNLAVLGWTYTADLMPPTRWWRGEAARGIAELEAALDD